MRGAVIQIGVAELIAIFMAWPQGRPADAPLRVPPGPSPPIDAAEFTTLLTAALTGRY